MMNSLDNSVSLYISHSIISDYLLNSVLDRHLTLLILEPLVPDYITSGLFNQVS